MSNKPLYQIYQRKSFFKSSLFRYVYLPIAIVSLVAVATFRNDVVDDAETQALAQSHFEWGDNYEVKDKAVWSLPGAKTYYLYLADESGEIRKTPVSAQNYYGFEVGAIARCVDIDDALIPLHG